MNREYGFLAVGNFDSSTGYAWKLMEKLWLEAASTLREYGYRPIVVYPSVSDEPKILSEAGFQIDALDFKVRSWSGLFKQCLYIRRNDVRCIYFTDFATASWRYAIFKGFGVKKIIIHDHMPGIRTRPGFLKRLFKRLYNRAPFFAADQCFAVSPYIARRLEEVNCFPRERVVCITNGIHPPQSVKTEYESAETTKIVSIGRANYYKGIDFALSVLSRLVQRGDKTIRYTLYGDGPDLEAFKALARKLGVDEFVDFPGATNDIGERLPHYDIAFHPSRGEAMSLALLEYMGTGLPVLTSDNSSVSSFLTDGKDAVIYRSEDVEDCAEKLGALISSVERRKEIGWNARLSVLNNYTEEKMLREFREAMVKANVN
ncbi:glycosyltransferase family 4 protein [Marinimicrobium alkaliphilum]|uniref:glycosyltransferase family 4 protein n=1 Tax=Marinimicrobium alkaliphilum TaxID=2202654 RepID=UPI000DB9ABF7|nr:glycosyltransferase family 4 protein [Marinimicrobium alkaliphilum]